MTMPKSKLRRERNVLNDAPIPGYDRPRPGYKNHGGKAKSSSRIKAGPRGTKTQPLTQEQKLQRMASMPRSYSSKRLRIAKNWQYLVNKGVIASIHQ